MHAPRTKSTRAFTKTELLVTIACLALLAVIFVPALAKAKARPSRIFCRNNMKSIGLAFKIWAVDNHGRFPMQVSTTNGGTMEFITGGAVFPHFLAMSNELPTPHILLCPMDKRTGSTQFTPDLTDKNISYFLNVDAVEGAPFVALCGDRNLTNSALIATRLVPITKYTTLGWTEEMHSRQGNLAFADGSVGRFNNGHQETAAKIPDGVTNRLAVP